MSWTSDLPVETQWLLRWGNHLFLIHTQTSLLTSTTGDNSGHRVCAQWWEEQNSLNHHDYWMYDFLTKDYLRRGFLPIRHHAVFHHFNFSEKNKNGGWGRGRGYKAVLGQKMWLSMKRLQQCKPQQEMLCFRIKKQSRIFSFFIFKRQISTGS